MTIIFDLQTKPGRGLIKGNCAQCKADVYESDFTLSDCYNVWMGRCPHCKALNYLSTNHGLRGYSSSYMHLVLPTTEEIESNGLPPDTPSQGSKGPATMHGSPAGEIMHQLREADGPRPRETLIEETK